ncbi:hypothetical protein ABWK33_26910, partial [Bacillus wiedmannii]
THDEFLQEFVEWVDSKGWSFMGMTDEITPEEASQNLIDSLIDEYDIVKNSEYSSNLIQFTYRLVDSVFKL